MGAKILVASAVYNLAGPIEERTQYLRTLVGQNNFSPAPRPMGELITAGYQNGAGMRLRRFHRWANSRGYVDQVGAFTGHLNSQVNIDLAVVQARIPAPGGETVSVQQAWADLADIKPFAEQWLLQHEPATYPTDWICDYVAASGQIVITRVDTTTVSFTPTGFDKTALYLYAAYNLVSGAADAPTVVGDTHTLAAGEDWPSTTGWTVVSTTTNHSVYRRTTYIGSFPADDGTTEAFGSVEETMYHDIDGAGVYPDDYHWRVDTRDLTQFARSAPQVFIYRFGAGDGLLDAMLTPSADSDEFYPWIPVRADNKWLSDAYLPEVYPLAREAYKRAINGDWDELIAALEDNEDLPDLDWIYVVFGVSLNTQENASKRYLWKFLQALRTDDPGSAAYAVWQAQQAAAESSAATWNAWKAAQGEPGNPLFNTPEPPVVPYPYPKEREVQINSTVHPELILDMRINWLSIEETAGAGPGRLGAKRGDLWWEKGVVETYNADGYSGVIDWLADVKKIETSYLWFQETADGWRRLKIRGLVFRNYGYKGKFVEVTAHEAIDDPEESDFLVPLHDQLYRSMGLIDGTQMATACVYLQINCLKVKKKKWYQKSIFKVLLFALAVALTIYFGVPGLLGANAAVGAALGFAGTMAILVGAIANVLAAMLLMRLITTVSIAAFGAKAGAIIGAIASLAALQVGTTLAAGESLSTALSWASMMDARNILALTNALGQGISGYIMADAMETLGELQDVQDAYAAASKQVADLYASTIGYGMATLDPMGLTDTSMGGVFESPDTFLARTLMTGSEVADLSMSLLTRFAELTLSTDLPS